jgi:hypothetical protein
MHVLVHETAHGYGPIHEDDLQGLAVAVEETTTEMVARAHMKEDYGYDINRLRGEHGDKIPAAYQRYIEIAVTSIAVTYDLNSAGARQVLEHASTAFKQLPRSEKSFEQLQRERDSLVMKTHYAEAAKVPDGDIPSKLFARTVDAVIAQGPKGEGNIEPKHTERAEKLHDMLAQSWYAVME